MQSEMQKVLGAKVQGVVIKWTKGNRKLKKTGTIGFGLPAYRSLDGFKVCPQAGACAAVCYARQGSYTWPATIAARHHNLELVRRDPLGFTAQAVLDLRKMRNVKSVRIHDSGDFFSQEYLDSWIVIAMALPSIIFYAYSKSLHLNFVGVPSNLRITQSEGGLLDSRIDKSKSHSRIFSTHEAREAAGYMDGNGEDGDAPAMRGETRIGLVYHGTRNMTAAQVKAFA